MSDDKRDATFHDGQSNYTDPAWLGLMNQHGARPPVVIPGPATERPFVSPGVPPWGSLHQDIGHEAPRRSSTLAVWALVTGVVGVMAGWCLFGLPCIAAVVLGHVALNQTKDDRMTGRGMAVAGLVLGYVALIPAVILTFYVVAGGLLGTGGAVTAP